MTISITLPDDLSELVAAKVATGVYKTSDHVIRSALKLLQQHDSEREDKLAWLSGAIQEGIDSGEPEVLDIETFIDEMNAEFEGSKG